MTPRVRAVLVTATVLAALGGASAASAHPAGQRPVIEVERAASGLRVSWILANDDLRALGLYLGLFPADPVEMAEHAEWADYVTSGIDIIVPSVTCSESMTSVERVATGYATNLAVACDGPVETMTLRSRLLLDLSPSYVHAYRIDTDQGPRRGSLTSDAPTVSVSFDGSALPDRNDARGRLEALVRGEGDLSLFIALGIALALGMVHGLTPGHGKTLTAAYLAGSRGTLRQAALLSVVVALAHGISTLALAAIASGVSLAAPAEITPWLEGASALLAVAVGVALLRGAVLHRHPHATATSRKRTAGHRHAGGHHHPRRALRSGMLSLVGIGLVGGLIPGPEAFAVGFLAVALDRLALGLLLILAFSIGLALVVFAVAAFAVAAGKRFAAAPRLELVARRAGGVVFIGVALILATNAITP